MPTALRCVGKRKAGAMFLFVFCVAKYKAKTARPGPEENSVRNFTGGDSHRPLVLSN